MSLNVGFPRYRLSGNNPATWNPDALQRSTEGVIALLLALKKKPLIRYARSSIWAKKLATEVRFQMTQDEQLFDFRRIDTPPILLIVDRREDPVTPLLTQWTYQAMVHELLEIRNGRVDLSSVPEVRPELKVNIVEFTAANDDCAMLVLTSVNRRLHFHRTKTLSLRKICI